MNPPFFRGMISVGFWLLLSGILWASPNPKEYAGDLGPSTIDVSAYPADMQAAYGKFQTKCGVCHSTARAVNSDLITEEDWKGYIKRMWLRPPCCNLCPVISQADAQAIWKFLTYDSKIRKTGANAASWEKQRWSLLAEFKRRFPKKYQEHYATIEPKGKKTL